MKNNIIIIKEHCKSVIIGKIHFMFSGRPIQFGNLTFVWRSPKDDKGPVKFSTSIVYKGQFMIIEAKINGSRIKNGGEVPYQAFPVRVIHHTIASI